ncbi:PREDICTED: uncharacterized protein LOC106817751 isoform X2 [Priapulus caudatus]|uniref:Uncharacterized protein LOC106817751 isoform X2 n=1 Tax=Priapulus caudatus TaxID=37621 RepID=A0ABM1F0I2_PRICU|nr:PREDICTED: uncharacterized protein LOC106817751 isoform X2 [Priapulus caudatus]
MTKSYSWFLLDIFLFVGVPYAVTRTIRSPGIQRRDGGDALPYGSAQDNVEWGDQWQANPNAEAGNEIKQDMWHDELYDDNQPEWIHGTFKQTLPTETASVLQVGDATESWESSTDTRTSFEPIYESEIVSSKSNAAAPSISGDNAQEAWAAGDIGQLLGRNQASFDTATIPAEVITPNDDSTYEDSVTTLGSHAKGSTTNELETQIRPGETRPDLSNDDDDLTDEDWDKLIDAMFGFDNAPDDVGKVSDFADGGSLSGDIENDESAYAASTSNETSANSSDTSRVTLPTQSINATGSDDDDGDNNDASDDEAGFWDFLNTLFYYRGETHESSTAPMASSTINGDEEAKGQEADGIRVPTQVAVTEHHDAGADYLSIAGADVNQPGATSAKIWLADRFYSVRLVEPIAGVLAGSAFFGLAFFVLRGLRRRRRARRILSTQALFGSKMSSDSSAFLLESNTSEEEEN